MNLQTLLGTELPLIQAPMAGVQGSTLAVAVSNAGGLGSLPGAMLAPDALRLELVAIRSQTTRPCNVNFFCHAQPAPDVARGASSTASCASKAPSARWYPAFRWPPLPWHRFAPRRRGWAVAIFHRCGRAKCCGLQGGSGGGVDTGIGRIGGWGLRSGIESG